MKRHTLLITVLFALFVSLFSVSVVFWEFYKLNKKQYIEHIFTRYALITQIYTEFDQTTSSLATLDANLAVYNLERVQNFKTIKIVLNNSDLLKEEVFKRFD